MRLEGWQIVMVVVLAIVLFGAPKLPGLARSVGQSLRIFKSEVRQMKEENGTPAAADPLVDGTVPPAPAAQPQAQSGHIPPGHVQPAAGTVPVPMPVPMPVQKNSSPSIPQ